MKRTPLTQDRVNSLIEDIQVELGEYYNVTVSGVTVDISNEGRIVDFVMGPAYANSISANLISGVVEYIEVFALSFSPCERLGPGRPRAGISRGWTAHDG